MIEITRFSFSKRSNYKISYIDASNLSKILQFSSKISRRIERKKKKRKLNEKLISRVWKQFVTWLPDSRETTLIREKSGNYSKGENTMEKTRFAEYSQRYDGTISTIISQWKEIQTYVLSASFSFHCCALLVPGTISYLEIRTCNYFKEHHSFRVMYMADA